MGFEPFAGDLMGLPTNENHLVIKWITEKDCKILFSLVQHGKAISGHFASDKKGLRFLKEAIKEFCEFVFSDNHIEVILAKVIKPSVGRFISQCGFEKVFTDDNNVEVYARYRTWAL